MKHLKNTAKAEYRTAQEAKDAETALRMKQVSYMTRIVKNKVRGLRYIVHIFE